MGTTRETKVLNDLFNSYDELTAKSKKLKEIAKMCENLAHVFYKVSDAIDKHTDDILAAIEPLAKEAGKKFGIKV